MAGSQDKTEKPTDKRAREAREKGQIAKSKDLSAVLLLLASGWTIYWSASFIRAEFGRMVLSTWGNGFQLIHETWPIQSLLPGLVVQLLTMIGPVLLVGVLTSVLANVIQDKGLLFASKALQPKFSKLNPFQGLKQLFSTRSAVEALKSMLKFVIVGFVVYSVLRDESHSYIPLVQQDVLQIINVFGSLSMKMLMKVFAIMFVMSLADFGYQKWQHQKDMMMSKEEVKEEHKQAEGNPFIKSRIRSIQKSLARQRMMSKVSDATVVITNPTHYAVVLKYEKGMSAPLVVAKGVDHLARKIIQEARKHRVPVVRNPPLARALYSQVKLEGTIPLALYKAVAKVLAYIYQQKQTKQH